jgi:hypothetical protein
MCARSLQHRQLMAKDNQFQHKGTALAKPRPYAADPLKDPACHESQTTPEAPYH